METLFDYKEYKGMIRVYYKKMRLTPEKIVEVLREDGYDLTISEVSNIIQELEEESHL